MNSLFFLIFVYLLEKVYMDYETIELEYNDYKYYIPLNFPNKTEKTYYIFSTKLPMSFFPSPNCTICQGFNLDDKKYTDENKSIVVPYYFYNFTGKLYKGDYSTDKYVGENDFLLFQNMSYLQNYTGKGRFSLSYLNYNFNTSKKIFALKFSSDGNSELHLGDYDHLRNMEELKTFNIITENIYENYTETIIKDKLNNIYENNFLIEEDNNTIYENITYEVDKSVWYMNFSKLLIKRENEEEVDNPLEGLKLTLDMSVNRFYIPRKFFLKNVQKILPKEAKCQITPEGYFLCLCDEEYKTKFGNFKFITESGVEFLVNVTDYMTFESSISGSKCQVHLVINYDNDLFIGGTNVLNNYYTIFDIDNKTLSILPAEDSNIKQTGKFIILFFIVLILAVGILFGGYFFYNKYVINDPTGLVIQNNNNNNNNNDNIRQIRDLQRQNEFQPDIDEQNIGNN
jgi:hypothetical protein